MNNSISIYGGAGDDKIGGAEDFDGINIYGEEGNDVVYGGANDNMTSITNVILGTGDDTYFGGSGGD